MGFVGKKAQTNMGELWEEIQIPKNIHRNYIAWDKVVLQATENILKCLHFL